jgi:geranylgeranyl reductase family protein
MTDQLKWTCDVLVIGAGPAGSMAARCAARKGVSVILLERRDKVGLPVRCAEFVPLPVSRVIDFSSPALLAQPIRSMKTFIPGEAVQVSRLPGAMIRRDRLDQELALLAVRAGVRLETGFQALTHENGRVTARGERGPVSIAARIVIGADGPSSRVAGWLGIPRGETLAAAQVRVPLKIPMDHTRIYFRPQFIGGYGWLFPKGREANVGVGLAHSCKGGLMSALRDLQQELKTEKIIGEPVLGQMGGLVPVGGLTRVWKGKMILAGDAAGTCHPISGAGIANALLSGEMAGEAAAGAVQGNREAPLRNYEKELTGLLGRSLGQAARKRKALMAGWHNGNFAEHIRQNWIAFKAYYHQGCSRADNGEGNQS